MNMLFMTGFIFVGVVTAAVLLVLSILQRRLEELVRDYDVLQEQLRLEKRAGYNRELNLRLEARYWEARAAGVEGRSVRQAQGIQGPGAGGVEERLWTDEEIARLRNQAVFHATRDTRHPTLSEAGREFYTRG